jgi:hypothetical protein
MDPDVQLAIVVIAAGVAGVYAMRRVVLQFQRPDDEPAGCHACPANRIERARPRKKRHAR